MWRAASMDHPRRLGVGHAGWSRRQHSPPADIDFSSAPTGRIYSGHRRAGVDHPSRLPSFYHLPASKSGQQPIFQLLESVASSARPISSKKCHICQQSVSSNSQLDSLKGWAKDATHILANRCINNCVALTGLYRTGPPCSVGRQTAHAPGPPARRQRYKRQAADDDRRRQTPTTVTIVWFLHYV